MKRVNAQVHGIIKGVKPNKRLIDVLLSTDKAHKQTTGEADPDWADWWAEYLLKYTDFNELTQRDWRKNELSEALAVLKTTYEREQPRPHWSHFFALRLSN